MRYHEDFEIDGIRCYMNKQEAKDYEGVIIRIEKEIREGLKDTNFESLSFCDVSAPTIQVNLFNTKIKGFVFVSVDLQRDWSNVDGLIAEAIERFKARDNEKDVKSYQDFLNDGMKYGWD